MYRELLGALAKQSMTKRDLASAINVSEKTIYSKINGKIDFTFSEAKRIRDLIAPNESLDILFNTEQEHKN